MKNEDILKILADRCTKSAFSCHGGRDLKYFLSLKEDKKKFFQFDRYLLVISADHITEASINSVLSSLVYDDLKKPSLVSYAYIYHDKDIRQEDLKNDLGEVVYKKGDPKPAHYHINLIFDRPKTAGSVASAFGQSLTVLQPIDDWNKQLDYLIHDPSIKGCDNKYHYDKDLIVSNIDIEDLYLSEAKKNIDYLSAIIAGEIKEYEVAHRIPAEYYIKNKQKIDRAFEYIYRYGSEACSSGDYDRNLKTLFVTGAPRVGKDYFAKKYALSLGYAVYTCSVGDHPFDEYKGQECIIWSDARSSLKFNDLLQFVDPHVLTHLAARYNNKSLCNCKLIIFTSSVVIDAWYQGVQEDQGPAREKMSQLYARFPKVVCVTNHSSLRYYYYDLTSNEYTFIKERSNPWPAPAYISAFDVFNSIDEDLPSDTLNPSKNATTCLLALYDNCNDIVQNEIDIPF